MASIEQGIMRFSPHGSIAMEITSPEGLARAGFVVHPDAVDMTWGEGAADRYYTERQTIAAERAAQQTFSARGSIGGFQR